MTAAATTTGVRERSNSWLGDGAFLVVYALVFLLILPQALSTFQLNLLGRFLTYAIVLVVEHDMVFVRQFASKVTVLHMGQMLCEGPIESVQSDSRVIEVYLGRSQEKTA